MLDLLDRKILTELDINSRAPLTEIGKKAGASKETVKYRIDKLITSGVITEFYTAFNTAKLNHFYYKLLIKLHNVTPQLENEILDYIKNQKYCAYLGSSQGSYDVVVLLMVKTPNQFQGFITELKRNYGEHIIEKDMHFPLNINRFNIRLYDGCEKIRTVYEQDERINNKVDEQDIKILNILSINARMPLVEIGQKLNLDPKVIKYRIKRLEKEKVILRYMVAIDYNKLGKKFTQINFIIKDLDSIPEITNFFDRTNKCIHSIQLLGKYDLTIEIFVDDNEEIRNILGEFKKKFLGKYLSYDILDLYKEYTIIWGPFYWN
ncbi:MAG: AsnC family transcriptional regulator [Candidatus ainarchaeum sp.]|nr:AsnC family transcriptional regulator [Candidatus ainarchaeum sp.]